MNEALKQSAYAGPDVNTEPLVPVVTPPFTPPPRKPVVFSGQADDGDLWSLVKEPARPDSSVQSFEEALRRVDNSLELLVGGPSSARGEAAIEPIIEAEVVSEPDEGGEAPALPRPAPTPAPAPAATEASEEARLRRQRLLRRAMEQMGGTLEPTQPSPSPTPAPPPSSPSRPPRASAPTPPPPRPSGPPPQAPSPTPAEQQLAAQVEQRSQQLTSKPDHFAVLGVPATATKDQVKAAFLGLAKIFHPDRVPPSLPKLAPKMGAVFESIRAAYDVLYDDAKRAAWVASRAASQAPTPAAQAADLVKVGESLFRKRDYRQAEEHFARAHALDKSAHSLAAQGWAIYMDPARKSEGGQARALMQNALSIDPDCDRAHYQLGVIARVEGDVERAERHFREAVRVNPRHLEANQELRLIEMRRKKAAEAPKKGFFR